MNSIQRREKTSSSIHRKSFTKIELRWMSSSLNVICTCIWTANTSRIKASRSLWSIILEKVLSIEFDHIWRRLSILRSKIKSQTRKKYLSTWATSLRVFEKCLRTLMQNESQSDNFINYVKSISHSRMSSCFNLSHSTYNETTILKLHNSIKDWRKTSRMT